VGVTSNLAQRIWVHREGLVKGFTRKYGLKRLVHVEFYDSMYQALCREKRLKKWRRLWKIRLIEEANPGWRDLYDQL
jgi:putative endonuclease